MIKEVPRPEPPNAKIRRRGTRDDFSNRKTMEKSEVKYGKRAI